jgi:hypothetical protein
MVELVAPRFGTAVVPEHEVGYSFSPSCGYHSNEANFLNRWTKFYATVPGKLGYVHVTFIASP